MLLVQRICSYGCINTKIHVNCNDIFRLLTNCDLDYRTYIAKRTYNSLPHKHFFNFFSYVSFIKPVSLIRRLLCNTACNILTGE